MLPLFPAAVEQFDLDGFDLVISTSHCAVKSALAPGRARHLCYCFTPMRYAWDQFDAYFGPERLGALSDVMRPVMRHLARWDASTAHRPDRYVAISQYVARRIARYYNRRSAVVYPPVDTGFFTPGDAGDRSYGLVVSALVPYKRVDLAIGAALLGEDRAKIADRRVLDPAGEVQQHAVGAEIREILGFQILDRREGAVAQQACPMVIGAHLHAAFVLPDGVRRRFAHHILLVIVEVTIKIRPVFARLRMI
jgi:hypothetical protein